MSTPKHTPAANWHVTTTVHTDRKNIFCMTENGQYMVGTLIAGGRRHLDRFERDARLIGATPDFLAALAEIATEAKTANDVIRLKRDGGGQGRIRVATAMHRIARLANAAIAKAEDRS